MSLKVNFGIFHKNGSTLSKNAKIQKHSCLFMLKILLKRILGVGGGQTQPTGSIRWLHKEREGGGEGGYELRAQQRASRNEGRRDRGVIVGEELQIGELILPRQCEWKRRVRVGDGAKGGLERGGWRGSDGRRDGMGVRGLGEWGGQCMGGWDWNGEPEVGKAQPWGHTRL